MSVADVVLMSLVVNAFLYVLPMLVNLNRRLSELEDKHKQTSNRFEYK